MVSTVLPLDLLGVASGASTGDMRAALLARLAGDEVEASPPAATSPLELLTSALAGDPASADVVEALHRRAARDEARAEQERTEQGRDADEEAADDVDGLATPPIAAQDAAEVVDVLTRLHFEVGAARERISRLAAAIGACPRCVGEDAECPVCRGRGVPGARRPRPDLFDQYVRPAIRRTAGAAMAHPTTREST